MKTGKKKEEQKGSATKAGSDRADLDKMMEKLATRNQAIKKIMEELQRQIIATFNNKKP